MDVEDLRSANEKWEKQLKKDLKSWTESLRYRVRNLKARTQNRIADLKQQTDEGEKADDGDKNTGGKGQNVGDLLGNTDRVDNEVKADHNS